MNENQKTLLNEVLKAKNFKYMINLCPGYLFLKRAEAEKIFNDVVPYMETVDESCFVNRTSVIKAVQKYFVDNQPELTAKNYTRMIDIVLKKCQPKISSLARKLVNANGSYEDYVSEMQIEIIRVLRKYEGGFIEDKSKGWADWVGCSLRVAHNKYADLCKEFSQKSDCSLFTQKFDDEGKDRLMYNIQDDDGEYDNSPAIEGSENVVIANELYDKLLESLSREENGDEMVAFVRESVNPSDRTWECYDEWLSESANRNPFKNKVKIPSKVICKSIGIEYNKVNRFKEVIGITLIKLGVNYGDVFPKYKSMNRNFWLSRGCPAPEISYNPDGSAVAA